MSAPSTPALRHASDHHIGLLVTHLEKYPAIWDSSCKEFTDKVENLTAWLGLSEAVGLDVKDVKRTYETLRNRFRTECKARLEDVQNGITEINHRRPYKYFESLYYLLPHMRDYQKFTEFPKLFPPRTVEDVQQASKKPRAKSANTIPKPPGRFPKFLTESFQERVLGSSSSSAVKVDVKADLKRKLPKSSFDLDSDVTKKACDVLTEADDVHLWALSLAADLRSIDKPMARKRVMHSISGLLLDELEKYEAEKALAKSTTYEIVSFQSANTDTAEVIATEAATAVETSTSG